MTPAIPKMERGLAMVEVLNHDVAGLCRRVNRFIVELHKAQSANTSEMDVFDQERLQTYLDAITVYRGWVINQPQLDLPETYPREVEIGENPETPEVENESTRDAIYLMELARDELAGSQSARRASGFIGFDDRRLMALVGKTQAFLTDYIKVATPIDMPESSPARPGSGAGLGGI